MSVRESSGPPVAPEGEKPPITQKGYPLSPEAQKVADVINQKLSLSTEGDTTVKPVKSSAWKTATPLRERKAQEFVFNEIKKVRDVFSDWDAIGSLEGITKEYADALSNAIIKKDENMQAFLIRNARHEKINISEVVVITESLLKNTTSSDPEVKTHLNLISTLANKQRGIVPEASEKTMEAYTNDLVKAIQDKNDEKLTSIIESAFNDKISIAKIINNIETKLSTKVPGREIETRVNLLKAFTNRPTKLS
jgi:hypothetical protein